MMALNACILIKAKPLSTDEILQKTRNLKGVRTAFLTYGRYDIVAFVDVADYAEVREITSAINSLEGVRSTETLVEG